MKYPGKKILFFWGVRYLVANVDKRQTETNFPFTGIKVLDLIKEKTKVRIKVFEWVPYNKEFINKWYFRWGSKRVIQFDYEGNWNVRRRSRRG